MAFDPGKKRKVILVHELRAKEQAKSHEEARAEREREFVQKFCSASTAGQARIIFEALEQKAGILHRHPNVKY